MKKRTLCLLLILALTFSLAVPVLAEARLNYITEVAGLLDSSQWADLEARAQRITEANQCGVYAVILEDYRDYGPNPEAACRNIYEAYDLGYGQGRDGILLMLSMDDRDYALMDFGRLPAEGITDYGFDTLEASFLDDFGEDNWYEGLSDYLARCETLLEAANSGKPLERSWGRRIAVAYGIALAVGLVIALVTCSIFKSQMNTAVAAVSAESYVAPGGVDMQVRQDLYTHTTHTKRKIQSSSSGSGSGGNHSRSGKF